MELGTLRALLFYADSCCKILSGIAVLFNPIWVSHDGGKISVFEQGRPLEKTINGSFIHLFIKRLIKQPFSIARSHRLCCDGCILRVPALNEFTVY